MRRRKARDLAPINATFAGVQQWFAAQPYDADFLVQELVWSPTFSEQSFPAGLDEVRELWTTGLDVSWLGGPAVLPLGRWPRRADGAALAHALANPDGALDTPFKDAWPRHAEGLPVNGVLEVFHDLQTFGWEATDEDAGAWHVRWVPEPDRNGFAETPPDVDTPRPVCQAGHWLPGWTMPPVADFLAAEGPVFDAAEAAAAAVQRAWKVQRELPRNGHPVGTTHLYGHGQHETARALRMLQTTLPPREGDSHRLVLEVESWTHLDGWFGDAGTLQVWMRASDLEARRFERAWCFIRTD